MGNKLEEFVFFFTCYLLFIFIHTAYENNTTVLDAFVGRWLNKQRFNIHRYTDKKFIFQHVEQYFFGTKSQTFGSQFSVITS